MLIDSGSIGSFLKKKEWKRIGKPKLTDVVDYSFITVSGRILDLKGMYMVNVFFEGQEYELPVFVANGLRNNIAGISWLTVMDKVNWNRLLFPKKFEANQQKKLEKDSTSSEFLTMKVDINGFAITGMIDTGANHTSLTKKTWEEIGKPKIRKKIFPSIDASFKIIPCDGAGIVKINGIECKINVLSDSLPEQFTNIFGTDLMKKMEILQGKLTVLTNKI